MAALVTIATYNERPTIERVVTGAIESAGDADVLVIDDGSPDGTGELADELAGKIDGVHVLHRPSKAGFGSAVRAGMAWGLERHYDAFCLMDADLSHDPADVRRLLDALSTDDMAIGSRYVAGGGIRGWPMHRKTLSRFGNAYVRTATGLPVRDCTAGFRAFRRHALVKLRTETLKSEGYAFMIELTLRAWRQGLRIGEVPIVFTQRSDGESKMSGTIVAEALWRVARWGVQERRRKK